MRKKILFFSLLFLVINNNAKPLLFFKGGVLGQPLDDKDIEKTTKLPYRDLIAQARGKRNCNYIIAQVKVDGQKYYYDGQVTHDWFSKTKQDPFNNTPT